MRFPTRIVFACLSLLAFAGVARGQDFDEVSLRTVPAGAASESGKPLLTTVTVDGKGDVKVELVEQPGKVLGTKTGKATPEEVSGIAKALEAVRRAPAPPKGAGYDLTWRAKGAAGAIVTAMPHHEARNKEPVFQLGDRLRAIQARLLYEPYGNEAFAAKSRTIEGLIEVKGKDVYIRHEKLGPILVRDTARTGSLAYHLKSANGEKARLIGRVFSNRSGLAMDVEAVEARAARRTELYMGMTADGFPYSVTLEKGTIFRVRSIVADADGNDYSNVDVAGGLQGAILRPHVKFAPTPAAGIAEKLSAP